MSTIGHTARLPFPNGEGYTPCSQSYLDTVGAQQALYTPGEGSNLDALTPAEYQLWNMLDARLDALRSSGHVGRARRYASVTYRSSK